MVIAASHKKGKPNPAQEDCFELEICPDLILAAMAAAAAGAFTLLYTAITMAKRRKRRALNAPLDESSLIQDAFWLGTLSPLHTSIVRGINQLVLNRFA